MRRYKHELSFVQRLILMMVPFYILKIWLPRTRRFSFFHQTTDTQVPIKFDYWYNQMVRGHCRHAYWPVHPTSSVGNPKNIYCGIETSPGYSPGNYIQAIGKVYVGDYTQIGPNVAIISANHDPTDTRKHIAQEVRIGRYNWIGTNACIMPGVTLGDFTVVAAGAVVTKSFGEGYCVVGGNPARVIKVLDRSSCVPFRSENEFNGYLPAEKFQRFRSERLEV